MNKCYKTIWNEALGAWVAASENDASRGKPSKNKVAIAVALGALAFSGGGAFLSKVHAAPGLAVNMGTTCYDYSTTGGLNYCSNRSTAIVGSYASSGQFVVMDAGGTMVEVSADTGLIYFRPGGTTSGNTSGNVLTMASVSGGVLLNGTYP
ncbi:ESPR domain-containing protein [Burkholderia cenocepacia]|uniref:ESPR domain-containing protein n=1 Tax=Burkholderia cenocepacia TaxID=95486 RepID=UPI002232A624|nr:ESPR domain-containing protein [Burkholderia cenocepacia]MCW3641202.1 ESPR domain-containing protein [Burkholderia cenocepacia]